VIAWLGSTPTKSSKVLVKHARQEDFKTRLEKRIALIVQLANFKVPLEERSAWIAV